MRDRLRYRSAHRRGYVLVVTLGLLVLASTMLVTIGRAAMNRALAAKLAQEQLQRRWGVASCRSAVLPYAPLLLTRQEQIRSKPMPVMRMSVRLGGQNFELVISDEQAKANVNALLSRSNKGDVESRLRGSLSGIGLANAILIHPDPAAAAGTSVAQPVSGPGQLFENVPPQKLIDSSGAPMERMTFWGNGAINIMRASEPAMRLALEPDLDRLQIGRVIDKRNSLFGNDARLPLTATSPPSSAQTDAVAHMLTSADVDLKVRAKVAMTTTSSCFSLWIVAQDRRRSWYHLYVRDEANMQRPRMYALLW